MPWERRRSWTADIFCGLGQGDPGVPRCDATWARDSDNNELAADAVPSQPRFLMQELIFTHRPSQLRLRLSWNFLCRIDWLLRGTARPERTIVPWRWSQIQDDAGAGRAPQGERSPARRSLLAPVRGDQTDNMGALVLWSDIRSPQSVPDSRFVSRQQVVPLLVQISAPDVREKEEKLDSRRLMSPGCRLFACGRQRTGNRASVGTDPEQRRT